MYRLTSPQVIVENVVALSKPFLSSTEGLNSTTIKNAYRQYLTSIQPHCPKTMEETLFYADTETEQHFDDYFLKNHNEFTNPKLVVDINNVLYPDAEVRKSALENCLENLKATDPVFVDVFKLVMNTVFCTVSKNIGGTSVNPNYIGVMCAHYDMNAEEAALPELLIHEFTHNALFLDELRYKHFDYTLMNDPATHIDIEYAGIPFKMSAHRCLHSIIVAVEVLKIRDELIGHTPRVSQHVETSAMINRVKIYLNCMKNNKFTDAILTPRAKTFLESCSDYISRDITQ